MAMAKFAVDCLARMNEVTKESEILFGPDTADLRLRIGLHSGPVTGGFLKGKGARFQLFGDTMNVASRMESTGEPDRIQLSEATASLLRAAEKDAWIHERTEKVHAKGKGFLQTYWLVLGDMTKPVNQMYLVPTVEGLNCEKMARKRRLVEWNVQLLQGVLKEVLLHRLATDQNSYPKLDGRDPSSSNTRSIPLHEIQEIIAMPKFNSKIATKRKAIQQVTINDIVLKQLDRYVSWVADMYNDNPFHSFAHASHVVQSTAVSHTSTKSLQKILKELCP